MGDSPDSIDKLANWSVGVDIACECDSGTEYGSDIYQPYKSLFVPCPRKVEMKGSKET